MPETSRFFCGIVTSHATHPWLPICTSCCMDTLPDMCSDWGCCQWGTATLQVKRGDAAVSVVTEHTVGNSAITRSRLWVLCVLSNSRASSTALRGGLRPRRHTQGPYHWDPT